MRSLFVLILVFLSNIGFCQLGVEWFRDYGGNGFDRSASIVEAANGDYIVVNRSSSIGGDISNPLGLSDVWCVRIDADGNIIWDKNFGGTSHDYGCSITKTNDLNYVVAGVSYSSNGDVSTNQGSADVWVFKMDDYGNLLWENSYGSSNFDAVRSIIQTNDNGFILAGFTTSINGGVMNQDSSDVLVIKLDSLGNVQWTKTYGGSADDEGTSIIQLTNGNYVFTGLTSSLDGDVSNVHGGLDVWIVMLDSAGNIIREKTFGGSGNDEGATIRETTNNNLVFNATLRSFDGDATNFYGQSDIWIVELDSAWNIIWQRNYGGSTSEHAGGIEVLANGNYVFTGQSISSDQDIIRNVATEPNSTHKGWVVILDSVGNILQNKLIVGSAQVPDKSIVVLDTSSFVVLSNLVPSGNGHVTKLKPLLGQISGTVLLDANNNCIVDSAELLIGNMIVQAYNAQTQNYLYTTTDSNGYYSIDCDTTIYQVSWEGNYPLFQSSVCSFDTQTVVLNDTINNGTANFYLKPDAFCSLLTVDVGTNFLRRCFSSNYVVNYCNNGTVYADSAYVEVTFDTLLTVNSASLPWSAVNGNTYTFLLGDIDVFECGSFSVNVTVDCDSTFIGQSLCVEAAIYPDTACFRGNVGWSGAELRAETRCLNQDTVEFELKNIGTGDMTDDVPVIVIEDVILRIEDSVKLDVNQIKTWKLPISGITHRIVANQPALHPYKTYTTDAVMLCNTVGLSRPGPIFNSAFSVFPNDEESPFVAVDCQPIIGAYDPNDKTVYPTGTTEQHFISANTDLEYRIRFQNTGNDTAFTVYITDSISPWLDITTIQPGAASHPYQFDVYGNGVVRFTFNNINLVDSFTNEPASNGFVNYKIKQKAGNVDGNVIYNNADIFFDYNPPVRTNTVFNTIGSIVLDTVIYKDPEDTTSIGGLPQFETRVFPNPANDYLTISVDDAVKTMHVELYDAMGKLVLNASAKNSQQITIHRNQLPQGIYWFKLTIDHSESAIGKVVFR